MRTPSLVRTPLVIGHRGSCGYRPENTLLSFRHALELGADAVELDVLSTSDGFLIVRHDAELSVTTDVASRPEFANRRRTVVIDGISQDGWFCQDFTLAEIQCLYAVERQPRVRVESAAYRTERVPTLAEAFTVLASTRTASGQQPGIRVEIKHPRHHAEIGLPMLEPLLSTLDSFDFRTADGPAVVQCFEAEFLRQLADRVPVQLVQLMAEIGAPGENDRDMTTPAGLARIAEYAMGIGPDKAMVVPRGDGARPQPPTSLVEDAHAAGLVVNPYTFRDENAFLAAPYRVGFDPSSLGDGAGECRHFLELGVDGLFTDFVDSAVTARSSFLATAGK